MAETGKVNLTTKERIARCIEWLKTQNNPKKLSLQNKNDIQFIIETNAHRKKFFLNAEDDATVPAGVDEVELEPRNVPLKRLRTERLCFECEWQSCRQFFSNYIVFQVHVATHLADVHKIDKDGEDEYVCLWDVCGHKTTDKYEMVRHVNYHAYHAKLLAIGFNGRATLKLERCKKDSTKRNVLPPLKGDHCCMWFECFEYFVSMQAFLDHVREHIKSCNIKEMVCSWAGCGMSFTHRGMFATHVRSHTGERLIACYHCGQHFSLNKKLANHLLRQNVDPSLGQQCSICKQYYATAYLLREHVRQHVSCYACSMCDMSSPSKTGLALHIRYRHMRDEHVRTHQCPRCDHRAKTNYDLKKHMVIHNKKMKKHDDDSDDSDHGRKKVKERREYICHMCPANKRIIFTRGTRLTTHLVKEHEARWPCGHSRFRYQKSEDGFYRLTTTRFEVLEISKKIVDGYQGPKAKLTNKFQFNVKPVAEATACTPKRFEITLKNTSNNEPSDDESDVSEYVRDNEDIKENIDNKENKIKEVEHSKDVVDKEKQECRGNKRKNDRRLKEKRRGPVKRVKLKDVKVEDIKDGITELHNIPNNSLVIEMCDMDSDGNIIKKETIESNIMYGYDSDNQVESICFPK